MNALRQRAVASVVARLRSSGNVFVSDTTLRDGEQMPRIAFSTADKVRIAKALDAAGVHSIDAGFAAAGETEVAAIEAVAAAVGGPVVMSLARALPADIDLAARALARRAAHKRGVAIFIGTSPSHREAKLGRDRDALLETIDEAVRYAAGRFDIVTFGAEDATRTEPDFLFECLRVAIDAGATTVGIPDTVGILLPSMAHELVRSVLEGVPNIERALLAVHFHDDLGLAVANSLAAVEAGAHVVQCTVGGIGERAGNAALEEVVLALALHAGRLGRRSAFDTAKLVGLSRLVAELSGLPILPHKAVAGENVFATEAGIHQDGLIKDAQTYSPYAPELVGAAAGFRLVLGKHSGRNGLSSRLADLGLTADDAALDGLLLRIKTLPRPSDADDDALLRRLAADAGIV